MNDDVLIKRDGQEMFVPKDKLRPSDIIDERHQQLMAKPFRIKGWSEYQAFSTAHRSTREEAELLKAIAQRRAMNLPSGQTVDNFFVGGSGVNWALYYCAKMTRKQAEKFWDAVWEEYWDAVFEKY